MKKKRNKNQNSKFYDYIVVPFCALLLAMFVRTVFFDNFHVPSGSMKSTLVEGDKIFISKFSYGYSRYSIPFGYSDYFPFKLVGRFLGFWGSNPQVGDIIVFKYPEQPSINYVKRLIGLPGDEIQVKKSQLYINGRKLDRRQVDDFIEIDIKTGKEIRIKQFVETLPNGKEHLILDEYDDFFMDNTDVYKVPEGHYFFMGDNRDHSQDSRFASVGFVKEELLLGRVKFILISSPESLLKFYDWHHIRFNRIFKNPD